MIHKVGGIFALFSFFFRYGYMWPKTGSLGFRGSPFDWFSMCMHLMLSASAIQFRVPSRRQPRRPTMIWHEARRVRRSNPHPPQKQSPCAHPLLAHSSHEFDGVSAGLQSAKAIVCKKQ